MRIPCAKAMVSRSAGLIFLFCAPSLLSQSAKVTYSVLYSHIDASEPVVLALEFSNLTDGSLDLNLGWRDQIFFTATGPSGKIEIHEPPPNTFDQIGRFGEVTISPKGTYRKEIVLSQWAPFDTPGDYIIEIHLRGPLGLHSPDSLQVQRDGISLVIEADAQLVMRHCAEEWNRLKEAQNGGEAMSAALFLGNVKSPLAVPFISSALTSEHATAVGGVLITGLERIGSLGAVKVLADAMRSQNQQNAQFAHDALNRIAAASRTPEIAGEARSALESEIRTPEP
jgi:hypothetical protein